MNSLTSLNLSSFSVVQGSHAPSGSLRSLGEEMLVQPFAWQLAHSRCSTNMAVTCLGWAARHHADPRPPGSSVPVALGGSLSHGDSKKPHTSSPATTRVPTQAALSGCPSGLSVLRGPGLLGGETELQPLRPTGPGHPACPTSCDPTCLFPSLLLILLGGVPLS